MVETFEPASCGKGGKSNVHTYNIPVSGIQASDASFSSDDRIFSNKESNREKEDCQALIDKL